MKATIKVSILLAGLTLVMTAQASVSDLETAEKFYADKNYVRAAETYRKAVVGGGGIPGGGSAIAQTRLGDLYAQGLGVTKNEQEAAIWYRVAANQDFAEAQDKLGMMYSEGRGVAKDDGQAWFWFKKAADKGLADAQYHAGWFADIRRAGAQAYVGAYFWYRKAADQGHIGAQYHLGLLYDFGWGVQQDFSSAVLLYADAAMKGSGVAQFQTGMLHENGSKPIGQNRVVALSWFQKAADQGYPLAQPQIDLMKSDALTPCENNDTDYSAIRAMNELPIKPGLWEIHTHLNSRANTPNKAERKICLAKTTVCIDAGRPRPSGTIFTSGSFWNDLARAQGNPFFGKKTDAYSKTEDLSEVEWHGNDPFETIRTRRIKHSDEWYELKENHRVAPSDLPSAPAFSMESTVDRLALFIGTCSKDSTLK